MRTSLLCLIAALALGACDRSKPLAGKSEVAPTTAARVAALPAAAPIAPSAMAPAMAPAAAPMALAEQPRELPMAALTGIWRVTGVVPDQGSAFAADDPRIVRSLIDVTPDQIRWSYKTSSDFASDDVCMGPVAGIIDDREYANKARQLIAPALGKMRASVSGLSRPHQWLCGDGGSWGSETEFQQLAEGRVAMRWTGGVTLILNRVRKIASNPPPLPPTGAYEDQ